MRLIPTIIATACTGLIALPLMATEQSEPDAGARRLQRPRALARLDADASGGISLAELQTAARRRQRRPQHPAAWKEVFAAADTDGDGELNAEEFAGFGRRLFRLHFKHLDADGDGEISLAEFQAHRAGRREGRGDDADAGDAGERRARRRRGTPAERFARADTDGSGGLSPAELRAARRARRRHRQGRGAGPEGEG
ncbi:MAG: EF-hand domain-containing protein [Planctomycetota bacterium]